MAASSSSWRELVPGLVSAGVIAGAIFGVLRYAQVGALRGDTIELVAPVAGARGIMKGSEVWLAGYRVGKVTGVEFRAPESDTTARLLVRLRVLTRHRALVRTDSYAQIRSGSTLIGSPVVYISPGTSAARPLADGDTLRTKPQFDTEGIGSQLALAARQFPEIMANVRVIGTQLAGAHGTAGALLEDDGRQQLTVVGERAGAVLRAIGKGDGTVGLALRDGAAARGPVSRAQRAMASADTLRALLTGNVGSVGRFRRDSTLTREVKSLLDEVSIVRALLAEPRGTAGRALHDRAAYDQIERLERELRALMEDLRRNPLRYVVF